jgi:SAM-dependent methyltransferase
MASIVDRLLDMGFVRPRGLLGRVGGRLMARGNAATEQHVVELAGLQRDESVLVLGPGPGIGLHAAAVRAARVVGVDPSEMMLAACRQRCGELVESGTVELVRGDAENTGQRKASVDVVLSVNNVMLWPDWRAGFSEVRRVLRPGGRMLLSGHEKWLPGGLPALTSAVTAAGFDDVETWTWEPPPSRGASTAAQLRALRPAD